MVSHRFFEQVHTKEHWVIGLMLFLGVVNGLIFVFLVPPWQHYDEPSHFEYAWLISNRKSLPRPGDYDQNMRQEVAASMLEHGFYRNLKQQPDLLSATRPIDIGFSQTDDLPLYYLIVAAPLWLLRYSDITFQLYAARIISLLLYLVSLLAAAGLAAEISPAGHPVRWMLPLSLALLPGYTDIMTAVNNDVGAAAFFALFFLISVKMIWRGFSWLRLAGLIATTSACLFTKNTVAIALPLAGFTLIFSILNGKRRWFALGICGAATIAFVVFLFTWGEAARWMRQSLQPTPVRAEVKDAPLGSYAFQLVASADNPAPRFVQLIRNTSIAELRGKTVTIGAWIWAERSMQVRTPTLIQDSQPPVFKVVSINKTPTFFVYRTVVNKDTRRLMLTLEPAIGRDDLGQKVFYDGIVMIKGEQPLNTPPHFDYQNGQRGRWGGSRFNNSILNGSAERPWPMIRPLSEQWITKIGRVQPSSILYALLNWSPFTNYYKATAKNLLYTFWGKFGWGHVPLIRLRAYTLLAIANLLGMVGSVLAMIRLRRIINWELVCFFGISILVVWSAAFFRGVTSITNQLFIPSARYAFPVAIPTMILLLLGWVELSRPFERRLHLPPIVKCIAFLIFFIGLDALAIISIIRFYYPA